jgi:hypothetical protein
MTIKSPIRLLVFLTSLTFPQAPATAQDHPPTPAGMTHEQHQAQMKKDADLNEHGEMAMGFDQNKAAHHFTLTPTGGTIAVTANHPSDRGTREQIQAHLEEIAASFASGDFEKPLMTHGEMPPGVSEMQRHKADITYRFKGTDRGGVVRIVTADHEALKAVHEFLRYQIREHATGDPLTVRK